tara:strand:+ start:69031 stop:69207 length:177 start_codon:yes stop_codon:yes gene_type:complete
MTDKDVKDLKVPSMPLVNPFKRHPVVQALIDISDHVLSFFLWLLFGLLIGLTFNFIFS